MKKTADRSTTRKPEAMKLHAPAKKTAHVPSIAPARSATKAALTKLRAKYDKLLSVMQVAMLQETREWDRYYESVGEIVRERLWIAAGYDTTEAWLHENVDVPVRTARANIRVAENASPDEIKLYGSAKIYLALQLLDAIDAQTARERGLQWSPSDKPRSPEYKTLKWSVTRSKKAVRVGLKDITANELRTLIKAASPQKPFKSNPNKQTESAAIKALRAKGFDDVTVREHDAVLTIGGVRADQLNAVGAVLAKVKVGDDKER